MSTDKSAKDIIQESIARMQRRFPYGTVQKVWIKNTAYKWPLEKDQCLHQACQQCRGTGRKDNGQFCVHMIACKCPNCRPVMRAGTL
jgi:hypothetical protein